MKLELAHDFVAKKIYEEASIEDKARAKATTFLHERYKHYLTSNDLLLTERDLLYIAPYVEQMDLTEGELSYIEHCKLLIRKLKFRNRLKDAALVALVCTVVFSSWGFWEHNRFQHTSKALANAKDTINTLRNMEKPIYFEDNDDVQIVDNSYQPSALHSDAALSKTFHSSIKLTGTVKNEQNEPISSAIVRVLGAEVLSNKDGSFEFFLILSPKDLPDNLHLRVSKLNYLSNTQNIDTDKAAMKFDLVLVRG